MKVLLKYTSRTYGCQKNSEGVMGDWQSFGEDSQVIEFEPREDLSIRLQAIKAMKTPYQFGNSHTVCCDFKVEVIEE